MEERFPAVLFPSVLGSKREQTYQYLKIPIASWTAWCTIPSCAAISSVLSVELVDFLLVALSCSSSRSTTARLIGDVRVSVLKMFHPPSDTAGTHAGTSRHTTKSLADDSCCVSLRHKKIQRQ
jgi:hypothetical protein